MLSVSCNFYLARTDLKRCIPSIIRGFGFVPNIGDSIYQDPMLIVPGCFTPPCEKSGYMYMYIVLHLSVDRSVDRAMSAQYLLTPMLKSCWAW